MHYCYSYLERRMPKNFLVAFRLYYLNLNVTDNKVFNKYWNESEIHFIEKDLDK